MLRDQGLGKYCDPEFVAAASREMQEAMDMTPEEFDAAAHQLLTAEAEGKLSGPYVSPAWESVKCQLEKAAGETMMKMCHLDHHHQHCQEHPRIFKKDPLLAQATVHRAARLQPGEPSAGPDGTLAGRLQPIPCSKRVASGKPGPVQPKADQAAWRALGRTPGATNSLPCARQAGHAWRAASWRASLRHHRCPRRRRRACLCRRG